MKVFGPTAWGPALHSPELYVGPLEEPGPCLRCKEQVLPNEPGVAMPYLKAIVKPPDANGEGGLGEVETVLEHRECFLRDVVGSVGHQRGLCSCHGGPDRMDDPPAMTVREAARAALREVGIPLEVQ